MKSLRARTLALVLAGAAGAAIGVAAPASAVSYPNNPPVDIRTSACAANIIQGDPNTTCVKAVQDILIDWGYGQDLGSSGADGSFGAHTAAAVEAFQRSAGIGVDGEVGPQTKAAMYSASLPWLWSSQLSTDESTPTVAYIACLDADTNTAGRNGQVIQGWVCNNMSQQGWTHYAVPNHPGQFILVNALDGLCLDGDSNTAGQPGQKVQGWACNGQQNQIWKLATDDHGMRTVVNVGDSQCLDADVATAQHNHQLISLWPCNHSQQQEWGY